MIDEKKLIEELEKIKDNSKIQLIGLTDMINTIKRLPKVGEWIPCSERLPNKEVICCDTYGEIMIGYIYYEEISSTEYGAESETDIMHDVIAWMPLPAPYNE